MHATAATSVASSPSDFPQPSSGAASSQGTTEPAANAPGQGISITGICVLDGGSADNGENPSIPIRTIVCAIPGADVNARTGEDVCGGAPACVIRDPATHQLTTVGASGEIELINGDWHLIGDTWCPALQPPMPTAAQLRQHAIRLLPTVAIGTGWGGDGLINAETILWANTTTDRTLPDATIVGRDVAFRIHLHAAHWTFGDNTTATWHTPGA